MKLDEFKASPILIKGFRTFLTSDVGVSFMDLLNQASPANFPLAYGSTGSDVKIAYGRTLEHARILKLIEFLCEPPVPAPGHVESTFPSDDNPIHD